VTDSHEPTPASDEPSASTRPSRDETIDLDAIEADLDAVQGALGRLAEGNYWTDEVTGAPIPVEVLDADPLIRRA